MSRLSLIGFCVVMCFVLTANTGCMRCGQQAASRAAELAVEKASGGKVQVSTGGAGNVDLSGLAENLRYPGAKATARWTMAGEKGQATVYSFETSDPSANVVQFYKNALSGWKNSSTAESDKGTVMVYSSSDQKEMVTVTVSPKEQGGAEIVLSDTKSQ